MKHWYASCVLGFLLTGRFRPLCAFFGLLPDSLARRLYCRLMDRIFESKHVDRITAAWIVGNHLRRQAVVVPDTSGSMRRAPQAVVASRSA